MGAIARQAPRPVRRHQPLDALEDRDRRGVEFQGHAAGLRHLDAVADEAEPGDVGAAMHGQADHRLRRRFVQGAHRRHGLGHDGLRRTAELDRRAHDPGADRLGEEQDVPGPGAGVGPHPRRIHGAGHGVPELDLAVAHGVPAEEGHAGLA